MSWGVPKLGTIATVASGNLTLNEPAGVVQGDLMIACIAIRSTVGFANADWTRIESQLTGDTDATNGIASGEMWYCIRGASAPSLVFTRTGGDLGHGLIRAYSGGKKTLADVLGNHSSNTLAVANATVTTGTISTTEANELICAMVAAGDNLAVSAFDAATDPATASGATDTTTAPTAGTWIERFDAGTNTGADSTLALADAIRATAGATGTMQATVTASARHVMIASAFRMLVDTTVAAGVGALLLTGFSPTVTASANTTAEPGVGALALTGFAPTVTASDHQTVTPGLGQLTLTGFAPTVELPVVASPDVGALTLVGFAPTVTGDVDTSTLRQTVTRITRRGVYRSQTWTSVRRSILAPRVDNSVTVSTDVGALTLTGFAPSLDLSIGTDTGALSLTGFAPSVVIGTTASPDVGALILTGFAPSLDSGIVADVGALTLTGFAPTVVGGVGAEPGTGQLVLSGFAPTVSTTANVAAEPGLGQLALAGFSPSVTASDHQMVTAGLGELILTGFAPTVNAGTSAFPALGQLLLTGLAPTVTATQNAQADTATGLLVLNGFAPSLDSSIATATGALLLSGFAPTVTASDHQIAATATGALTLTGFEPSIATTANVTAEPGTGLLTLTGFAPDAQTTGGTQADTLTGQLVLTAYAPTALVRGHYRFDDAVLVETGAGGSWRFEDTG